MPNKCCVPGCRGNYDSNQQYTTVFKFPHSDPVRKEKWVKLIPRKDWYPSLHSVVCVVHFEEKYIIKEDVSKDRDGNTQLFPNHRWQLTPDAVPTLFPNLPSYISRRSTHSRTIPEQRKQKHIQRQNQEIEDWLKRDEICDFQDLLVNFKEKINVGDKWKCAIDDNIIVFYILEDLFRTPHVSVSVSVYSSMKVQVCVNENIMPYSSLDWIFPSNMKLQRWSQLENLLIRYQTSEDSTCPLKQFRCIILQVQELLTQLLEHISGNEHVEFEDLPQIKFLSEQFLLCGKARRYSAMTMCLAFMIHCQSSGCYSSLRDNKILFLPHPRYLKYLSKALSISENNTSAFLKVLSNSLNERERFVILQLDEIYVKQNFSYKGGNLFGTAENCNDGSAAKTIQAFMISSAFGHFKQVVGLVPVQNLKSQELAQLTLNAVNMIQESNFICVAIISDNNRLNRSMFTILSGGKLEIKIPNAAFPGKYIYLLFDSVHIFKCIRNVWLNQKDQQKTLTFPWCAFSEECENDGQLHSAMFEHIRQLYKEESNLIVKTAPKLNFKSVYPSNLERQKVCLVENIFHPTTITALSNSQKCYVNGTVMFLKVIRKWWTLMNVKNVVKGVEKRDSNALPFRDASDCRFRFLNSFIEWLINWKQLKSGGGLTEDTFLSLIHTTIGIKELMEVYVKMDGIDYILPGKFQTDSLEARFGMYRQVCGSSYNVSVVEVLEAEKKLSLQNILGLKSAQWGNLVCKIRNLQDLKELDKEVSLGKYEVCDTPFNVEVEDMTNFLDAADLDKSAMIYVSGYAAFKLMQKLQCNLFLALLRASKESDNEAFRQLNRGGLVSPSDLVLKVANVMFGVFGHLITKKNEISFLQGSNQKATLIKCAENVIRKHPDFVATIDETCMCSATILDLTFMLLPTYANVLLNNYIKHKNYVLLSKKGSDRKRKLNTYM